MEKATGAIASQIIPMGNGRMVLPNVAIAEVVSSSAAEVQKVDKAPDWLMGMLNWRGQQVPLVSFEKLCGDDIPQASAKARFVVLNTLNGKDDMSFMAIMAQDLPQLTTLDNARISSGSKKGKGVILSNVKVDGEDAVIPDLDNLETTLRKAVM
jgi:chemosensory pili system protein ChpC